jgi:hypothetical protein
MLRHYLSISVEDRSQTQESNTGRPKCEKQEW